MLPTDRRASWDDHVLNDPRVVHLWDEDREIGRWLAAHGFGEADGFGQGAVTWDEYFLFGPEGRWEQLPPDPVGSGAPVIGVIDDLRAELAQLLPPESS